MRASVQTTAVSAPAVPSCQFAFCLCPYPIPDCRLSIAIAQFRDVSAIPRFPDSTLPMPAKRRALAELSSARANVREMPGSLLRQIRHRGREHLHLVRIARASGVRIELRHERRERRPALTAGLLLR